MAKRVTVRAKKCMLGVGNVSKRVVIPWALPTMASPLWLVCLAALSLGRRTAGICTIGFTGSLRAQRFSPPILSKQRDTHFDVQFSLTTDASVGAPVTFSRLSNNSTSFYFSQFFTRISGAICLLLQTLHSHTLYPLVTFSLRRLADHLPPTTSSYYYVALSSRRGLACVGHTMSSSRLSRTQGGGRAVGSVLRDLAASMCAVCQCGIYDECKSEETHLGCSGSAVWTQEVRIRVSLWSIVVAIMSPTKRRSLYPSSS
ncbi:hypothetical protein BV25DRAFT_1469065 [Artomyces pyxidatus]|uniref:Uncharacterized protein n=1 Tax=Artomyces pyxidatus TaxID=48021 RepID=A0ACB8SMS3_9AGAM|nr:hypothetical protein BV25DRAFT_1469065 [Artomyces pyxidatus]